MSPVRPLLCALLVVLPALTAASAPPEPVTLLVTGHPHAAPPPGLARPDAVAWLDASAAPFFDALGGAVDAAGGRVLATWSAAPAARVVGPPGLAALLSAHPAVAHVQPDAHGDVVAIGGDVDAGPGAANTGGRQMIQAEEAWALGFRGEGVKLASLGTGIDPTHEAFRNADGSSRVVGWHDLVNGGATPYDDQGISTFVTASASGSAWYDDPSAGPFQEAGVAPSAQIIAIKFLDSGGSGSYANAIAALQWAFDHGADVTVNPWGGACTSSAAAVMQAVRILSDAGMVNVFSVGASGPGASSVSAPACGTSAISVGALGGSNVVYPPSSRGPCADIELGQPPRVCPDLVAKGSPVRSAVPRGACAVCDPSGYRVLHGSSAPTGFVGGGVALIEQMKRSYTGVGWNTSLGEEEYVLKETALDLGPPGPDDSYGWGLPQLMGVHALLEQSPSARLVATLTAPVAELRDGASATLGFTVRNMGAAVASGPFLVTLQRPDTSIVTLDARSVSLGLLESASASAPFQVTSSTLAGTYVLRGSFDATWTNATTGLPEGETILREASFDVRRVHVVIETDGIAASVRPGEPQTVRIGVRNAGNDDGKNTVLHFTLPDHYVVAHADGLDPTRPESRYASPAPTRVVSDPNFGRVTLVFEVGDLPQGATWSFDTTFAATRPGNHPLLVAGNACDPTGRCSSFGQPIRQEVRLV